MRLLHLDQYQAFIANANNSDKYRHHVHHTSSVVNATNIRCLARCTQSWLASSYRSSEQQMRWQRAFVGSKHCDVAFSFRRCSEMTKHAHLNTVVFRATRPCVHCRRNETPGSVDTPWSTNNTYSCTRIRCDKWGLMACDLDSVSLSERFFHVHDTRHGDRMYW